MDFVWFEDERFYMLSLVFATRGWSIPAALVELINHKATIQEADMF